MHDDSYELLEMGSELLELPEGSSELSQLLLEGSSELSQLDEL
jgi:hypothetical protein